MLFYFTYILIRMYIDHLDRAILWLLQLLLLLLCVFFSSLLLFRVGCSRATLLFGKRIVHKLPPAWIVLPHLRNIQIAKASLLYGLVKVRP